MVLHVIHPVQNEIALKFTINFYADVKLLLNVTEQKNFDKKKKASFSKSCFQRTKIACKVFMLNTFIGYSRIT